MPFTDLVTSERALIGTPNNVVQYQVIHHLDVHDRDFIAKSVMVMIARLRVNQGNLRQPEIDFSVRRFAKFDLHPKISLV